MQRVSRRNALKSLGLAGIGGLAGCLGSGGDGGEDTVKAAFIYDGRADDQGWTYRHEEARKQVDEEYDWLETSHTEEVAVNDFARNANNYINQGYDVIFGTTFGYMDPMLELAKENPDMYFENAVGVNMHDNMGRYDAHFEQGRYFIGMAAGMVTETNTLGYIGGNPIAYSLRDLNAFAVGARSVNEDVTVIPRWLNTWHDPPKAKQAVQALADEGADVVAELMDSAAAEKAAASQNVWASGVYSELGGEFAADNYLSSAIVDWAPFYDSKLEEIKNDAFESEFYWGGMKDGVIKLDDWGPQVPQDVIDTVEERKKSYLDGEFSIWDGTKFEGESESFLYGEMNSYVEGIEGEVPS